MSDSLLPSFLVSPAALWLMGTEATVFAALEAMAYVVLPDAAPDAPGGLYSGYMLGDRVFKDDAAPRGSGARATSPAARPLLAESVSPQRAQALEREFIALIEADTLADAKHPAFRLEQPLRVTPEFAPAVAREFRRIVRTGTMSTSRQLVRPAHEVAIGLWLATLAKGEMS